MSIEVSWRQTLGGGGLRLWVGFILDQEVGSRVDWVVEKGGPHEETLLDVRTGVNFRRAERVFTGRKTRVNKFPESASRFIFEKLFK